MGLVETRLGARLFQEDVDRSRGLRTVIEVVVVIGMVVFGGHLHGIVRHGVAPSAVNTAGRVFQAGTSYPDIVCILLYGKDRLYVALYARGSHCGRYSLIQGLGIPAQFLILI